MPIITLVLFMLGAAFGSFVNALVWRLHENSDKDKKKHLSILNGRSMCPKCRHKLAWYDLIPLISWLMLGGKCRYCKNQIAVQYPIVELTAGLIFSLSYLIWPVPLEINGQWLLLITWLATSVGLLALAVYDLKWMLLPNKIIYPTLLVAALGRALYIMIFESRPLHSLLMWALSVLIASGIFYLLFIISKGKWIGFGDVRLGFITGTVLADPWESVAMIFLASIIGMLVILPSLISNRKSLTSKLPYGPFLIVATAILVIYGDSLINWYKNLAGL